MTFKLKGKQITQTGALFTVALRKLADGLANRCVGMGKGHSIETSTTNRSFDA